MLFMAFIFVVKMLAVYLESKKMQCITATQKLVNTIWKVMLIR